MGTNASSIEMKRHILFSNVWLLLVWQITGSPVDDWDDWGATTTGDATASMGFSTAAPGGSSITTTKSSGGLGLSTTAGSNSVATTKSSGGLGLDTTASNANTLSATTGFGSAAWTTTPGVVTEPNVSTFKRTTAAPTTTPQGTGQCNSGGSLEEDEAAIDDAFGGDTDWGSFANTDDDWNAPGGSEIDVFGEGNGLLDDMCETKEPEIEVPSVETKPGKKPTLKVCKKKEEGKNLNIKIDECREVEPDLSTIGKENLLQGYDDPNMDLQSMYGHKLTQFSLNKVYV